MSPYPKPMMEESKDEQSNCHNSVIDVLEESSFQLTVDQTMIVVHNNVTNTDQLTIDKLGDIEQGYF